MEIPKEVQLVIKKLEKQGFQAFIVGGCVRDFLREVEPDDWDVTTNAKPEEIQKIFPKNFYENKFLTVTVQVPISFSEEKQKETKPLLKNKISRFREIEITTYRLEAKYTDKRHPDEIGFAKTIEEDLARRDFTVNAMALGLKSKNSKDNELKYKLIDPFGGQKDLKEKIIKTVGNAQDRFGEDALRMMRAIRFAVTLSRNVNWQIENKTAKAIKQNSSYLKNISEERIRDEFLKIIMSERAVQGIELLRELDLLKYIVPELLEGYGIGQNKHHIFDCYEHSLRSFDYAVKQDFNYLVRLAALFHDVGKPRAKRGKGQDSTFYNHEMIGARMVDQILNRLKFSKKDIEKIVRLVRHHLFYYNVGEVSESSVRRLVRQAGSENMEELLQVRMADRIGSGVPKAEPYKLRHLKYVIEKVSQDPISVTTLKVSGEDVMKILKIKPSPKVGQALDVLLSFVLEDPKKNKKEFLKKEIEKLGKLSEKELSSLSQKAKEEREKLEIKKDEMTKKKYWVT